MTIVRKNEDGSKSTISCPKKSLVTIKYIYKELLMRTSCVKIICKIECATSGGIFGLFDTTITNAYASYEAIKPEQARISLIELRRRLARGQVQLYVKLPMETTRRHPCSQAQVVTDNNQNLQ